MAARVTWTLTIGAVSKSLAAWGVLAPTLTCRSQAADELSFSLVGDVFADPPFGDGDAVALHRDGVQRFAGVITGITALRTARTSGWHVTAANAWWQLSRLMYQQRIATYSESCAPNVDRETTKVVLFQDSITGRPITASEQFTAAINYAVLRGVPIVRGTAPAFVRVPGEVATDLTVADVIRRCLQPTPDAVTWCTYDTGATVLHYQRRALLPEVTLDVASTPRLIDEVELRRRDDLVPRGVRLNYIGWASCIVKVKPGCVDPSTGEVNETSATVDSTHPIQLVTIKQDNAGLPNNVGGVIGTIELPASPDGGTEAAPIGLASEYLSSLQPAPWEGRIALHELDCSSSVRVGSVVNIANGHSAWGAMRALVQEVSESLATGRTQIVVGPPAYLSPQGFVGLVQFSRRRKGWDAFSATRAPGDEVTPNCKAGWNPRAADTIETLGENPEAAAEAIGGEAMHGAMTRDGSVANRELELCDGTKIKVYERPSVV